MGQYIEGAAPRSKTGGGRRAAKDAGRADARRKMRGARPQKEGCGVQMG